MQNAFRDPSRFFSGEQWVLGEQGAAGLDAAAIEQLKKRYQDDFIAKWREFIKSGAVLRYGNLKDASNKLRVLAASQSPLLELLFLVSQNTAVGDPVIANAFKASQSVVQPGSPDQLIGAGNTSYMQSLVTSAGIG